MSNSLAIAAVTSTLERLLETELPKNLPPNVPASLNLSSIHVTTLPPEGARTSTDNQLNLFLYHAAVNSGLSNMVLPSKVRPGETGSQPDALDLFYLITAYGSEDKDEAAHIVLGQAVRILRENSVLARDDIKNSLAGNDLYNQVEHVRVSPQPLSLEDISKLWSAFQAPYRISLAYRASVVLIETLESARTPLPVLTRGTTVVPNLYPPFPTIEEIVVPNEQVGANLGDQVALTGYNLAGTSTEVRFSHVRLATSLTVAADSATSTQVLVTIPSVPASWPSGNWLVEVDVDDGTRTRTSNSQSFPIAPEVQNAFPIAVTRDGAGKATVVVDVEPNVLDTQPASLLLGSREVAGVLTTPSQLTFEVEDAPVGSHYVRLRVDGVDSELIDRSADPPVFQDHKVEVS